MARETLIIELRADGTRRVRRDLQRVGASAAASTKQVNGLTTALGAIGGALILRQSIGLLASFGQEMSTVRAITEATAAEFADLQSVARELGATTRFSASEAAQGMTFLARAGFDVAETMETIDDTLKLAQAGALDLGRAADIASNVLRGFRLDTDEAGRVVDVLALAANRGNTTVEQLGEALKFVGPVASGVGLSLEETVASVVELSNAGLQATLAGTGLRRVISELESPSKKTQKEIKLLGEQIDRGEISAIGLFSALQRLTDAGVDTGRALEIFGDRGGPAFEVLSGGVEATRELTEELNNAGGTADRIAKIMDQNLNGALLALRSAYEELILSLGDLQGSFLEDTIRSVTELVRFLGERIEIVAGILAVALIPAVEFLFGLIAAHPIGLLTLALGGAVGALASFKDEILVTSDGLTTLGDLVSETWEDVSRALSDALDFWSDLFGGVEDDLTTLEDESKTTLENILLFFARTFDRITGLARGMVAAIIRAVQFLADEIKNNLSGVVEEALLLGKRRAPGTDLPPELLRRLGIDPSQVRAIEPQAKTVSERLGEAMGEAFKIGFQKTPLEDVTKGLFEGARQRGQQRQREELFAENELLAFDLQAELPEENLAVFVPAMENLNDVVEDQGDKVEKTKGFWDGMQTSFNEVQLSAEELGQAIGDALTNALDRATEALADFAISGFQNVEDLRQAFSDLFRDLAQQILQIIIKVLILKAIEGAFGSGGLNLGGLLGLSGGGGGGRQAGGPVGALEPVLVGERGPEIFVPPSQGNILPNSQLQAPETNVTIVNVDDEDSVPAAMNTPAGEEVILNTITRNREALQSVLA